MSSPAEAYAERRADEKQSHSLQVATEQREGLYAILHKCGFRGGDTWAEKEITRHLEAAFEMTHLVIASKK